MHPQVWRRIANARKTTRKPEADRVDTAPHRHRAQRRLHLALRPGTNVALMNGLIQQLIANNWIDSAYIAAPQPAITRRSRPRSRPITPTYVSGITGLSVADIQTAAQWLGQSREVWSLFIQGVYQSMGATDTVRLICAMHLVMGKIGRPGSAPFSITGQTTAMSNREAGGSSALSGYRNYYNSAHVSELETLWNVPSGKIPRHATVPITSNSDYQAIDSMVERMRHGALKVFWVACTNPAVTPAGPQQVFQLPRLQQPGAAVRVVQDVFEPIESMFQADLVLPAAMWGEKTGTYTCSERRVNLGARRSTRPGLKLRPAYGAYSDFDIIKMVADKLATLDARFRDRSGRSLITYSTPEACFEEWKAISLGQPCDMSGMSYAALEANNGMAWPSTPTNPLGGARLYTDGLFNTNWDRAQYGKDRARRGSIRRTGAAPTCGQSTTCRRRRCRTASTRSGSIPGG